MVRSSATFTRWAFRPSSWHPSEQMHIIIANNGRHIEEDQLKDLNMGKEIKNHFGISNVRKRLKLYYGEDAVIYFENVSPSGVKVHLFVPLQEEQKDEDSSY